jgi:hypothetical protein
MRLLVTAYGIHFKDGLPEAAVTLNSSSNAFAST